jgi:hypothetical protein
MTEIYRDFLQSLQVYAGYMPKNVQRLISVISLQFPIYSVLSFDIPLTVQPRRSNSSE